MAWFACAIRVDTATNCRDWPRLRPSTAGTESEGTYSNAEEFLRASETMKIKLQFPDQVRCLNAV